LILIHRGRYQKVHAKKKGMRVGGRNDENREKNCRDERTGGGIAGAPRRRKS